MGCTLPATGQGHGDSFHHAYALGAKVGQGSFGQVHVAESAGPASGLLGRRSVRRRPARAVKVISLCAVGHTADRVKRTLEAAQREEKVWKFVGNHRHCVELLASFADSDAFYFVMEKCESSLASRMEHLWLTEEATLTGLLRQTLLGLLHIHDRKVIHRDIKPQNLLLGGPGGMTVKVGDFGLAVTMPDQGLLSGSVGTVPYMSPEMASGRGHSFSTDMWSLGATTYHMMYGEYPYMPDKLNKQTMKEAVIFGVPLPRFSHQAGVQPRSGAVKDFVQNLLRHSQRLTAPQALRLPLLER